MGIEPTAQAWEAWVLPLYDARATGILVAHENAWQILGAEKQKAPRAPFADSCIRRCGVPS